MIKKIVSHFYSPNLFSKTVKIIVPNSEITNLNVNLENGSVFLKNIVFEEVNLASIRGNISLQNCNGGIASIDGYQSNISLKNITGLDCIANTKTGDVLVENDIALNTEINTEIGSIKLNVSNNLLSDTDVFLTTKSLQQRQLQTQGEKTKKLVLCAPYGEIKSNIF